jgi:phage regulator Rha-like protein
MKSQIDTYTEIVSFENIIHSIRGQKVILDYELSKLYQVSTKALNQAVRRNISRFPDDFLFILSKDESASLLRSQFVTLKEKPRGKHNKYNHLAFTEQGIAMLSSILRSERAILVNIQIMRAFSKMRSILVSNIELKEKIDTLEEKYDNHFKIVFTAIRELFNEPDDNKGKIGFDTE